MTPEQRRALAAARQRMASNGGQTSTGPQTLYTTDDGGRIYRGSDGQLGFVSDGFATRDPDTIESLMEGATPAQATDWTPEVGHGGAAVSGVRGALQGLTFGLGDEIVARGASAVSGRPYETELAAERTRLAEGRTDHPVSTYGGEVAGGVATGLTGIGAVGQANTRSGQIGRAALSGGALGGLYGFNSGEEGLENRLDGARNGALFGGFAGGASVPLGAGLSRLARTGKSAFQSLIGTGQPQRAQNAVGAVLARSGQSGDEVAAALQQAAREGQPQFAVADALGRPGQRVLSGVARSTPDAAQEIQEYLTSRQAGQGGRVASHIADAFDAPQSAAATEATMAAARRQAANANYAAARNSAGPVDVRRALAVIDDRIGGMQGSGVRGDGIDARLASFRNRLAAPTPERSKFGANAPAAGGANATPAAVELSDFNRVLGVKQDVQDVIGAALRAGRDNEARELGRLVAALDEALEGSSAGYRQANDAFAAASREIDQIGAGQRAAGPRARAEDTLAAFGRLSEGQQAAFRAGYADPLIARIESNAVGANAARPFTSQKFQQEAAAMATDPDLLARQLGRENTMFETGQTVLGGSRTADNLIDMEDASRFDTGALAALLRGRIADGVTQMVGPALNRMRGQGPAVRSEMARLLTQSGDDGADVIRQLLTNNQLDQAAKIRLIDQLTAMGGTGSGMLAAP